VLCGAVLCGPGRLDRKAVMSKGGQERPPPADTGRYAGGREKVRNRTKWPIPYLTGLDLIPPGLELVLH
jgi:uncharacterized protein YceK